MYSVRILRRKLEPSNFWSFLWEMTQPIGCWVSGIRCRLDANAKTGEPCFFCKWFKKLFKNELNTYKRIYGKKPIRYPIHKKGPKRSSQTRKGPPMVFSSGLSTWASILTLNAGLELSWALIFTLITGPHLNLTGSRLGWGKSPFKSNPLPFAVPSFVCNQRQGSLNQLIAR